MQIQLTPNLMNKYIWATIASDSNGYWMAASNMGGNHPEYNHNSRVDGSTKYGDAYAAFPRRGLLGGVYSNSIQCGSRGISSHHNTVRTVPETS